MPMPDYSRIPEATMDTLLHWIAQARPMGSFCEAVVSNDLREAMGRADEPNRAALYETVSWLYNNAPIGCWGSPAALRSWPHIVAGEVSAYCQKCDRNVWMKKGDDCCPRCKLIL